MSDASVRKSMLYYSDVWMYQTKIPVIQWWNRSSVISTDTAEQYKIGKHKSEAWWHLFWFLDLIIPPWFLMLHETDRQNGFLSLRIIDFGKFWKKKNKWKVENRSGTWKFQAKISSYWELIIWHLFLSALLQIWQLY